MHLRYKNKYRAYLEGNLEGETLKKWLTHAFEEDIPMKFSEQVKLLQGFGFKTIDTVWQHQNMLVYIAKK